MLVGGARFFSWDRPPKPLSSRGWGGQPVAAAEFYRIGVLIGWVFRAWGGSTLTPREAQEGFYPLHHPGMPTISFAWV